MIKKGDVLRCVNMRGTEDRLTSEAKYIALADEYAPAPGEDLGQTHVKVLEDGGDVSAWFAHRFEVII